MAPLKNIRVTKALPGRTHQSVVLSLPTWLRGGHHYGERSAVTNSVGVPDERNKDHESVACVSVCDVIKP